MAAHLVGLAAQLTMLHTPRCPSLVSMVCCRALVGLVLGVAAAHTLVSTASWRSARAPPPLPALATHCTVVLPAPAASSVRCSAPRDRHHNRTAKPREDCASVFTSRAVLHRSTAAPSENTLLSSSRPP